MFPVEFSRNIVIGLNSALRAGQAQVRQVRSNTIGDTRYTIFVETIKYVFVWRAAEIWVRGIAVRVAGSNDVSRVSNDEAIDVVFFTSSRELVFNSRFFFLMIYLVLFLHLPGH